MIRKICGLLTAVGVLALFGVAGGMEMGTLTGWSQLLWSLGAVAMCVVGVVGLNRTEETK